MVPNTLLILTPAIDEARGFYRDILGFALTHDGGDHLVFAANGVELHVFAVADPAPRTDHGAYAATLVVFEAPDLDAAMADLRAKGVEFIHQTPGQNRFMRYAAFRAPGGNVHELCQRLAPNFPNVRLLHLGAVS